MPENQSKIMWESPSYIYATSLTARAQMPPKRLRSSRSPVVSAILFFLGLVCFILTPEDILAPFFAPPTSPRRLGVEVATAPDNEIQSQLSNEAIVNPHTTNDVELTLREYSGSAWLIIFDGISGDFKFYHKKWGFSCGYRCRILSEVIPHALRSSYPDRFAVGQPPFQVVFSTEDSPNTVCLTNPKPTTCRPGTWAPILHFGSVPRDATLLPTVMTMPLPTYMQCMSWWHFQGKECNLFPFNRKVTNDLPWNELIPQVIWRGSDFPFYKYSFNRKLQYHQLHCDDSLLRKPLTMPFMATYLAEKYGHLAPRWRGVALSLQANVTAGETNELPWIDVKFTGKHEKKCHDKLLEFGIPVATDASMGHAELAKYKYHIDIGGGGGTTWEGTLQKLAMPGVLFHHETLTKDFFHDDIKPFVHYIPVKMDLSDLREKFDWAETHPEEAQSISRAATELVMKMGKKEYLKETYDRYFVNSLGSIVEAYTPGKGETADSILVQYSKVGLDGMQEFAHCSRDGHCTDPAHPLPI